jgi:hypothetical protein
MLSTAALAQPAPPSAPPQEPGQVQSTTPHPPPESGAEAHHVPPAAPHEADRGGPGGHGWSPMMMHHRMMMGEGMRPHRPPPAPNPAAHFRLVHRSNGTAKIDIKCAENESTKACVDAAVELLNKVETMGRHEGRMGSDEGMGSDDSDE